jgi:dTDP-4-amino-4,6-dideoxygalactose transaminase
MPVDSVCDRACDQRFETVLEQNTVCPAAEAVKNFEQIICVSKGQGHCRSRSNGTSLINVAAFAICLQGFPDERTLQYLHARFNGRGRSRR